MVTNEFLQAEQEEIGRWSLADSVARKQAYIAGRIALPDILSLRQDINSNTYEQLSNVLQLLHQAVVEEESSRRRADLGIQVLKSSQAVSPILAEPFADLRQHHESTSLSELRAESAVSDNSLTSKEYSMEASEQIPEDTIDIAEIMRQVRMRIAERQDHASARDLPQVLEYANQQWDKVYEPLQLPRLRSPLGRVWDIARLRFHNEVRSYLDPMMFRQTEFNSSVVRALNMLFRRGQSVVSAHEIEALRDEIIRLRTQVQRLEEKLGKE